MLRFDLDDHRSLRLLEERDAPELYALVEAERERLAQWMPWPAGQTLEGTLDFIRSTRRQIADDRGFQLAVVRDGAIAGCTGFHPFDREDGMASIGYWLAGGEEGRGTMTLAVGALTDHALTAEGLNRIVIQCAVGNARSRAIPERLGFRQEGILRQAERVGDRLLDLALYAMLAEEWHEARREGSSAPHAARPSSVRS